MKSIFDVFQERKNKYPKHVHEMFRRDLRMVIERGYGFLGGYGLYVTGSGMHHLYYPYKPNLEELDLDIKK